MLTPEWINGACYIRSIIKPSEIMYLRAFLMGSACAVAVGCAAQTDTTTRHHHELGLEMTTFLRQFLYNPGTDPLGSYYSPKYMFTYRYHFRQSNLRFGIGADVSDIERPAGWYNSQPGETYHIRSSDVALRIGWERYQELTRKWQVFYGIDLRPAWVSYQTDWEYSSGGYNFSLERTETHWALAPLAGIRFRLSPRFSILTESSFALDRAVSNVQRSATPQTPDYPPIEKETIKTTSFSTTFQAPLMVVAAFDL
jgi:hypothetical protein